MATSIGQYTPVFLPGEPPVAEKPGRPQSTGSQRVGYDHSDPAYIDARFFFFFFLAWGSSAPLRVEREGGTDAWLVGALALQSVQGHRLPPPQESWPYLSLFSEPFIAGNQKASLASLSP